MTDFKPDCTINLHVELRGKPAKIVWCCSMEQARAGRVILARRFLGLVNREEAELQVLLFGMRQAARFLQEKVEIRASFSAEDHLLKERSGNRTPQELKPLRAEAVRL